MREWSYSSLKVCVERFQTKSSRAFRGCVNFTNHIHGVCVLHNYRHLKETAVIMLLAQLLRQGGQAGSVAIAGRSLLSLNALKASPSFDGLAISGKLMQVRPLVSSHLTIDS